MFCKQKYNPANKIIKKKIYNIKKAEFIKLTKIRIFVKNPINGGTPAKENNIIVTVNNTKGLALSTLKACIVLKLDKVICFTDQNKRITEMLQVNKKNETVTHVSIKL